MLPQSVESLQTNVQRLKEYMSKLIEFPKKGKGEKPAVSQLMGTVLPIAKPSLRVKSAAITEDMQKAQVFRSMRFDRAEQRLVGIKQKRADEAIEAAKLKKK